MDCTICFDAITDATGHTRLHCGHTYHFTCIVRAFMAQDTPSSCPLCRCKMGKYDDIRLESTAESPPPSPILNPEDLPEDPPLIDASPLRVDWVRTGDQTWVRQIYCPLMPSFIDWGEGEQEKEDSMSLLTWSGHSDAFPPDSLVEATMAAATKMQALWRGWITRKKSISSPKGDKPFTFKEIERWTRLHLEKEGL